MTTLIVFDLDDVLADNSERAKLLDLSKPDWTGFFNPKNVAKDLPVKPIIDLFRYYVNDGRFQVEVWSGRPKSTELVSRRWVDKYCGVQPHRYRFRPNDNRQTNLDLKRGFLTDSEVKPSIVFDAQPGTSKMWHARGIQVCYCVHVGMGAGDHKPDRL